MGAFGPPRFSPLLRGRWGWPRRTGSVFLSPLDCGSPIPAPSLLSLQEEADSVGRTMGGQGVGSKDGQGGRRGEMSWHLWGGSGISAMTLQRLGAVQMLPWEIVRLRLAKQAQVLG